MQAAAEVAFSWRAFGGHFLAGTAATAVDNSHIWGLDLPPATEEPEAMSHLLAIIDAYKDAHGQPSDSSVARAIGVAPQTISSWRKRGIKEPPARETLRALATLTRLDYEAVVLRAALLDAGWLEESDGDGNAAPIAT